MGDNQFVEILNGMNPSSAEGNERVVNAFQDFFQKCTPRQRLLFLGKKQIANTPSKKRRLTDNETTFFADRFSGLTEDQKNKRVRTILKASESAEQAEALEIHHYENIWTGQTSLMVPERKVAGERLNLLVHLAERLNKQAVVVQCAFRLLLVCLAHDVQAFGLSLGGGTGRTARDSMLTHQAFRQLANERNENHAKIQSLYQRSSKYVTLVEKCGPGILLELGESTANLWEKEMTEDGLEVFLAYREEMEAQGPCKQRAEALNGMAGRMIVSALVGIGWDATELRKSRTSIMHSIKEHCGDQALQPLPLSSPSPSRSHNQSLLQMGQEDSEFNMVNSTVENHVPNQDVWGSRQERSGMSIMPQLPLPQLYNFEFSQDALQIYDHGMSSLGQEAFNLQDEGPGTTSNKSKEVVISTSPDPYIVW